MRLVGYERAPARLPRGSGAPRPAPRRWPTAPATRWRRSASPRSSAGGSSRAPGWRRWAAAGRRDRAQEPDLRRLRGDAHFAAAGPRRRRPPQRRPQRPRRRPLRGRPCRPARRRSQGGAARVDVGRGDPGRAAGRLAQAGRAGRLLRRQGDRPRAPRVLGVDEPSTFRRRKARADGASHPGISAEIRAGGRDGHSIGLVGRDSPPAPAHAGARGAAFYLELALWRWPASGAPSAASPRRASRPRRATSRSGSTPGDGRPSSGRSWRPGRAAAARSARSSRTTATRATRPPGRKGCSGRWSIGPTIGP